MKSCGKQRCSCTNSGVCVFVYEQPVLFVTCVPTAVCLYTKCCVLNNGLCNSVLW